MHSCGVEGIARVIALVSQQRTRFYKGFRCSRREFGEDKGVTLWVSQMGIVSPNLAARLEGIFRDAYDHRGFPIFQSGKIPWVSRYHRNLIQVAPSENIEPLVAVTRAKRVIPQVANEPICGHAEWSLAAALTG